MAVRERDHLIEAQEALEPKEDLTPYVGRWVALRAGHVIASDLNAEALRAQAKVKKGDVIVPVSRSRGGYFVA